MTTEELRQKLKSYCETNGIKPWRLAKYSDIEHPFPICGKNVYEVFKGRKVGKPTLQALELFFLKLEL